MPVIDPKSDSDKSYLKLIGIIQEQLHFNCLDYNPSFIKRRLNARMLIHNLPQDDYNAYILVLKTNHDEPRKLYDALTINVTQFFRDTKLWEVLKNDVLPKAIAEKKAKGGKFLNVWHCGCASGEEPYSLVILLNELIVNKEITPKIIATDIDEASLKKARLGFYAESAFKSTSKNYILRYFRRSVDAKGNEVYEFDPALRQQVLFHYHNALGQVAPGTNFDLIFCRNVIIYFTQETKNKIIDKFHEALAEHGWLIIGKSEVLFTAKSQYRFYVFNGAESIYRKERRVFPVSPSEPCPPKP